MRIKNCKVLPEEACFTHHRLLWAEVVFGIGQLKTWKLKNPIKRIMFKERVSDKIEGANVDHEVC